ncbi:STAS domain-containing protein [Halomonas cerina]|uniref:Phospholipid transport system transporter-binding protein n=1 Tax=Halomonas cerina TaxID=447424 RepID=A0A839VG90_9GAMM|nr:STAS domain-containing protein [Halomonas cerina]MBB3191634.1 phospholipid transport system transporter-binding protein [Halomonas cerina]
MSVLLERHGTRLETQDAVLAVVGSVDFGEAAAMAAAGGDWIASRPAASTVAFDLRGVDRISSVAISVLLEWTRIARQHGVEVQAVHLSSPLARLTRVAGLDTLLPLPSP